MKRYRECIFFGSLAFILKSDVNEADCLQVCLNKLSSTKTQARTSGP